MQAEPFRENLTNNNPYFKQYRLHESNKILGISSLLRTAGLLNGKPFWRFHTSAAGHTDKARSPGCPAGSRPARGSARSFVNHR
jgi:hypothetical protein